MAWPKTVSKMLDRDSIISQLITQENFTVFCCHESFKSYKYNLNFQRENLYNMLVTAHFSSFAIF